MAIPILKGFSGILSTPRTGLPVRSSQFMSWANNINTAQASKVLQGGHHAVVHKVPAYNKSDFDSAYTLIPGTQQIVEYGTYQAYNNEWSDFRQHQPKFPPANPFNYSHVLFFLLQPQKETRNIEVRVRYQCIAAAPIWVTLLAPESGDSQFDISTEAPTPEGGIAGEVDQIKLRAVPSIEVGAPPIGPQWPDQWISTGSVPTDNTAIERRPLILPVFADGDLFGIRIDFTPLQVRVLSVNINEIFVGGR